MALTAAKKKNVCLKSKETVEKFKNWSRLVAGSGPVHAGHKDPQNSRATVPLKIRKRQRYTILLSTVVISIKETMAQTACNT